MEEEINYRTLRKIQQIEKTSPGLTDVNPNFYQMLSEYLKDMEKRFEKENQNNKKNLLQDEMSNIKKIGVNIYEQREKKILLATVSKARGGNPDLKNLTESERDLFDSIYSVLLESRGNIFQDKKIDEKEEKIEKEDKQDIIDKKSDDPLIGNNSIIRINQDIPEFVGTDTKKYNLRKGDIVSLPDEMSETLVKRDAAKKIKS